MRFVGNTRNARNDDMILQKKEMKWSWTDTGHVLAVHTSKTDHSRLALATMGVYGLGIYGHACWGRAERSCF